tara:strand:+ start:1121 stop:1519 length:399 start_codon:yes stop_codon:yes gene_type:complete
MAYHLNQEDAKALEAVGSSCGWSYEQGVVSCTLFNKATGRPWIMVNGSDEKDALDNALREAGSTTKPGSKADDLAAIKSQSAEIDNLKEQIETMKSDTNKKRKSAGKKARAEASSSKPVRFMSDSTGTSEAE